MSLGLFVEGQSDKDTLPIPIRKIGYRGAVRCRVVDRGSMLSAERMEPYVRSLLKQHPDLNRILICIDGEESTPAQLQQRVVQPQRRLDPAATVAVRYAIVDRALEGWLACDEEALRVVLGPRARVNVRGNPEHDPQPAEILRRIFRDNGRKFMKTRHDPQIAERITPSIIARRSPTFTAFMQNVRAATRHRS